MSKFTFWVRARQPFRIKPYTDEISELAVAKRERDGAQRLADYYSAIPRTDVNPEQFDMLLKDYANCLRVSIDYAVRGIAPTEWVVRRANDAARDAYTALTRYVFEPNPQVPDVAFEERASK